MTARFDAVIAIMVGLLAIAGFVIFKAWSWTVKRNNPEPVGWVREGERYELIYKTRNMVKTHQLRPRGQSLLPVFQRRR